MKKTLFERMVDRVLAYRPAKEKRRDDAKAKPEKKPTTPRKSRKPQ